jgi:hypothetical protein
LILKPTNLRSFRQGFIGQLRAATA